MPPALLRSQLEALDPLEADEKGVTVSVDAAPGEITRRALAAMPSKLAMEPKPDFRPSSR
ncbi:hypothetical protein [Nonomuraea sp. B19D2]|uniref:hypothetical protein n=1 Tax=Nonomuraea sp. B19D2 TaxID=3159561 RepID=UPI0032DBE026